MFGDASDVVANLDSDNDLLDLEFDETQEASSSNRLSVKQPHASVLAPSEEDSGVDEGDLSPLAEDDEKLNLHREPVWMDEDDDNLQ